MRFIFSSLNVILECQISMLMDKHAEKIIVYVVAKSNNHIL